MLKVLPFISCDTETLEVRDLFKDSIYHDPCVKTINRIILTIRDYGHILCSTLLALKKDECEYFLNHENTSYLLVNELTVEKLCYKYGVCHEECAVEGQRDFYVCVPCQIIAQIVASMSKELFPAFQSYKTLLCNQMTDSYIRDKCQSLGNLVLVDISGYLIDRQFKELCQSFSLCD